MYFKKFKKNILKKNNLRKVVIYSTCFVNFNKKKTGEAALKVLHHNNVEVEHSYAGCCGMPYLEQADLDQVTKQAQLVSRELNKYIEKEYNNIIKRDLNLVGNCGWVNDIISMKHESQFTRIFRT